MKEITEVGVAVKNLEKTTRILVDVLGGEAGDVFDMPMFGMRFRMVRLGNVDFELMEPTDDDGLIARFIRTKGEGIHHVAFSVDRLSEEVDRLREKGCPLINNEPFEIFGGKVSFLHPRSFSGVAIELVEYPQGWKGWIVPRSEKGE